MNSPVKAHRMLLAMNEQKNTFFENEVAFVRRRVAMDLEPLVSKHLLGVSPSGSSINEANTGVTLSARKKIHLMSRVIEAKLFRSSVSLESHADPETLAERFKAVLSRLDLAQERSFIDDSSRTEAVGATRSDYHQLLRNHVGEAMYAEIQEASCKLNLLRQECVSLNVRNERKQTSEDNVQQTCAEDMIPYVLYQLYFKNRLLKSLGALNVHTRVFEINRVTEPDWLDILREANSLIDEVEKLENLLRRKPAACCCSYVRV
jgi:hypothetical protein